MLVRLIIGILLTYSGLTLTYYVMILFVTVCVCVCVCVCFVVVIVCCSLLNRKLGKIIWFGKPVLVSLYRLPTAAMALADALAVVNVKQQYTLFIWSYTSKWYIVYTRPGCPNLIHLDMPVWKSLSSKIKLGNGLKSRRSLKARQLKLEGHHEKSNVARCCWIWTDLL